jgi:hypothetical protein
MNGILRDEFTTGTKEMSGGQAFGSIMEGL